MTASPEAGPGRGGLSGDWLFVFSLRGPLFSVSPHMAHRLHMCRGQGCWEPTIPFLLPCLSVAGNNTLWAGERLAVSWSQDPASWWCWWQEGTDRTMD